MSSVDWLLQVILKFYHDHPDALQTVYRITSHQYVVPPTNKVGSSVYDTDTECADSRKLSVRVVNWFVGNFAKQHLTAYSIFEPDAGEDAVEQRTQFSPSISASPPPGYKADRFIVWNRYCTAKKGYHSKDLFDPYCRRNRITLQCGDGGSTFDTTVGQLNFFKWAIQTHVIDYVVHAYDDVVRDMNSRLSKVGRTRGKVDAEEAVGVDPDQDQDPSTSAQRLRKSTASTRRKKREELSVAACRCLKTISLRAEPVDIGVTHLESAEKSDHCTDDDRSIVRPGSNAPESVKELTCTVDFPTRVLVDA